MAGGWFGIFFQAFIFFHDEGRLRKKSTRAMLNFF